VLMTPLRIESEVYLKRDIENILQAIDRANACLAKNLPIAEVAIYRAGFLSAMQAVAAAFDVALEPHITDCPVELRLTTPNRQP
jgi:hypothetical protein